MDWVLLQIKEGSSFHVVPPSQQPPPHSVFPPPPPQPQALSMVSSNNGFAFNVNRVSPSILLIIIILAVIFFISGLLHLLVRFLLRPQNRDFDQTDDDATVLQGQLQQLFHLHDAGVDQSFIDTLPVFSYKSIIGVKDPFDCAVCLCEFEGDDKLRLLPKCSHAFHMECIDTWLLSHSTCPLCRASLLSDFSPRGHCSSPIVLVLESGSDSSREIVVSENSNTIARVNSHFSTRRDVDFVPGLGENESQRPCEIQENCNNDEARVKKGRERVVSVKLGKFRTIDSGNNGEGSTNDDISNNADARRCFSMGSFAYVMDETSSLQVPIRTPVKKQHTKKPCLLPLTPTHKPAMSECSFDSARRDIGGFDEFKVVEIRTEDSNNKHITSRRRESLSFSKIWLRGKKDRIHSSDIESSRRAVSFRFPAVSTRDESKIRNSRRTISEIGMDRWANCGIDNNGVGLYDEDMIHSCDSLDSEENNDSAVSAPSPSFTRRTLHWLMGKQNSKVVHSTFSGNV